MYLIAGYGCIWKDMQIQDGHLSQKLLQSLEKKGRDYNSLELIRKYMKKAIKNTNNKMHHTNSEKHTYWLK